MKRTKIPSLMLVLSKLTTADILSIEQAQEIAREARCGSDESLVKLSKSPFIPLQIAEELKELIRNGGVDNA